MDNRLSHHPETHAYGFELNADKISIGKMSINFDIYVLFELIIRTWRTLQKTIARTIAFISSL